MCSANHQTCLRRTHPLPQVVLTVSKYDALSKLLEIIGLIKYKDNSL
jgi:hypothetical protein